MWAVKPDIMIHLSLPPRATKMHEDMRLNNLRRGRGGCGFPAVVSGMLYGFIREGPLRAAKTMRRMYFRKGPKDHKETRSHAAGCLPRRDTKKHEDHAGNVFPRRAQGPQRNTKPCGLSLTRRVAKGSEDHTAGRISRCSELFYSISL